MAKINDENIEDAVVVEEPVVVEQTVVTESDPVETVVVSEPVVEPTRNVIYVQAPSAPVKKGNRGVGAAIAVASGIVFAGALALATALVGFFATRNFSFAFLGNPTFYIPTLFFIIGFVLLVLIANRAAWWAYILGSVLVAVFVYFGSIGLVMISQGAIFGTPADAARLYTTLLTRPEFIISALLAREVSLWFGSLISRRGRTVKVRNAEAHAAHERELAERRAEYERPGSASA